MSAFSPVPGPDDSQPEEDRPEQLRSAAVLRQNSRTGSTRGLYCPIRPVRGGGSLAGKRHRLVSTRKAAGFSQERLAEKVGVERSTVQRWERGETRPQPRVATDLG